MSLPYCSHPIYSKSMRLSLKQVLKRGTVNCETDPYDTEYTECYGRWASDCENFGYFAGLAEYRCSQEGCSCLSDDGPDGVSSDGY